MFIRPHLPRKCREHNTALNAIIAEYQPQAIATDGDQPPNYARLVGQESGFAPYPVWSTANGPAQDGSGDPDGHFFVPAEADTPVAANDGTLLPNDFPWLAAETPFLLLPGLQRGFGSPARSTGRWASSRPSTATQSAPTPSSS